MKILPTVFEEMTSKEVNKMYGLEEVILNDDMTFTEVVETLDYNELNYFYISLSDEDVLEAIENEKEIALQLGIHLVCIMPVCIHVAFYS